LLNQERIVYACTLYVSLTVMNLFCLVGL